MRTDSEGFLYPVIDKMQCISCGKCEKVCPVLKGIPCSNQTEFYAAQNNAPLIRESSSSGGVFSALANKVLQKDGAVCAAIYNKDFAVSHKIVVSKEETAQMRGAKYSQSHASHLFPELESMLKAGKQVLFVGTPCQCAGLKAYLGKDYGNLLLVDMICHGVPSPLVWQAYINRRKTLDAGEGKLAAIDLRNKSTGWSRYAYSVKFSYENGAVYSAVQGQDPFMRGFTGDMYLRPSCSACSFKGVHRCSDLTLGDCWGIWDTHPEFDDNRGTSLLMIHSARGKTIWNEISKDFRILELNEEEAIRQNPSAVTSSKPHPLRAVFFERLKKQEPVDVLIWDLLTPKKRKPGLIRRIIRKLRG